MELTFEKDDLLYALQLLQGVTSGTAYFTYPRECSYPSGGSHD